MYKLVSVHTCWCKRLLVCKHICEQMFGVKMWCANLMVHKIFVVQTSYSTDLLVHELV